MKHIRANSSAGFRPPNDHEDEQPPAVKPRQFNPSPQTDSAASRGKNRLPLSLSALALAGVIAGAALAGCSHPAANRKAGFANTTSITVVQDAFDRDTKQLRLSITKPANVRRITSTVRLAKKDPCWCLHIHHATFETPTERLEVEFCNHCFDVVEAGAVRHYEMPPEFYHELRRQIGQASREAWLLP